MRTYVATPKTIESRWHVIDAEGKALGRVATLAARLLQGKHKATYTPFIDTGDHVVIVNAADGQADRPQGRSEDLPPSQRLLRRIARRARQRRARSASPMRLLEEAVRGMLPEDQAGRCDVSAN